ncbi:MAG: hypothetical protein WKG07_20465 [Hymenobacter sp.]
MLSTTNYAALPPLPTCSVSARRWPCSTPSTRPEWEYRYYSYNPDWAEQEALLEMRDGEGDQLLVLFRPEGCVISGFLHEYEQPDKVQITKGLPAAFTEFMFGEPVNSIGTTFASGTRRRRAGRPG